MNNQSPTERQIQKGRPRTNKRRTKYNIEDIEKLVLGARLDYYPIDAGPQGEIRLMPYQQEVPNKKNPHKQR